MSAKRRSFEAGHRPKFLVVVEDTPECARAVHFAARRSLRTGAVVVMLAVVAQQEESLEFLGVGDAMRAEAEEEAQKCLEQAAARARADAGIEPELVLRDGGKAEAILSLILEDEDISFLVLAASAQGEGPGPLVQSIAGKASGSFPVPIVIVPGDLTEQEIEALAG
jgi:nucleotide-binding universal stress UspA family protein